MPMVSIDTTSIHYELHGKGDPLVFIAGLGSDHAAWDLQIRKFSSSFQCLAYDHRGIGSSPLGDFTPPYTIELLAKDLFHLLDHLGLQRVHMVGQSMGGTVAQAFALLYPQCLASLSLHVTWARVRSRLRMILQEQLHYMELLDLSEVIRMLGPYVWSEHMLSNQMELIEQFRQQRLQSPVSDETYRLQIQACLDFNLLDKLHTLEIPTLVCGAEEDLLIPASYSKEIAQAIPNSRYYEFAGCGHAVSLEQAEEFHAVTAAWIESFL